MAFVTNDYFRPSSTGQSCQYSQLGTYTSNYEGGVESQAKVSVGKIVVPQWGGLSSYESMQTAVPNCVNYQPINSAYGSSGGSCQTTFRSTLCGNNRQ